MVPHNAFMQQDLQISSRLSDTEQKTQLKEKVLTFMENNLDHLGGKLVLYHDSDPVLYNPDGKRTYDGLPS